LYGTTVITVTSIGLRMYCWRGSFGGMAALLVTCSCLQPALPSCLCICWK
jgi:hypothetical protein